MRVSTKALGLALATAFAFFISVPTLHAQESQDDGSESTQQREQPAWAFAEHSFTNENLKSEISQFLTNGYVPVGMDVRPDGTLTILYALNTWFEVNNWAIQEFTDLDNLTAELTTVIQEGWVPMAMSATDDSLHTILIQTELDIEEWQIAVGPLSSDSALATLDGWKNDGYTPWAITLTPDDEIWYLFLRQSAIPTESVLFNGFDNNQNAITAGLNRDLQGAWYPWGLMRGDESTFIQYLR
jgi:hypothetical protein